MVEKKFMQAYPCAVLYTDGTITNVPQTDKTPWGVIIKNNIVVELNRSKGELKKAQKTLTSVKVGKMKQKNINYEQYLSIFLYLYNNRQVLKNVDDTLQALGGEILSGKAMNWMPDGNVFGFNSDNMTITCTDRYPVTQMIMNPSDESMKNMLLCEQYKHCIIWNWEVRPEDIEYIRAFIEFEPKKSFSDKIKGFFN